MKKIIFSVFVAVSVFFAQFVFAESISHFNSNIVINEDATVDVTETITYDFEDLNRHGIYRDIPIKYDGTLGSKFKADIDNIKVRMDDAKDVPFHISNSGDNKRIKIGEADRIVTGKHKYVISYTVHDAVTYFDDHQEFYWNVTGNNWNAPINTVTVTVTAPAIDKVDCFAGPYGSKEKCDSVGTITEHGDKSQVTFAHNSLDLLSGVTVVIGMPDGTVYQPTTLEKMLKFIGDNWIFLTPIIFFIWAFGVWWKYGRDPEGKGTIVPYYDVPDDLSVAEVSAIMNNGLETKDISAMIIQLAVKGHIKIKQEQEGKIFKSTKYTFHKLDSGEKKQETLTDEESDLLRYLFAYGSNGVVSTDDLEDKFYTKISSLKSKVLKDIKNKGYLPKESDYWGAVFIVVAILQALLIFIFITFFGQLAILVAVINIAILTVFAVIMGHRTKAGVIEKEKLLGLKLYLETAEKDRIKFHNAPARNATHNVAGGPAKNPKRFEKLLPYAMVFGVEKEWAKQFKDIYNEQPDWYESTNAQAFNSVMLANSLSSFSSAAASSLASAPSSASSGGSGFSGGGSGGGFG